MILAFQRPKSLFEKWISWYTAPFSWKFSSKWKQIPSHVEIVLSQTEDTFLGFSSRNWTEPNGTSFLNLKLTERYEFVEIETSLFETEIKPKCDKYNNKRYDWKGVFLSSWSGFNLQSPDKWYCSEVVAEIIGLDETTVTPADLYLKYKKDIK